jgi:hypothetical protein
MLAGRHPLHAAAGQQAFIAGAVAVAHAAGQHVGDRFKAAVRVVGEAGDVIVGLLRTEIVQHQERVEATLQGLGQHAVDLHASAIHHGLAADNPFHCAGLCDVVHIFLLDQASRAATRASAAAFCWAATSGP